MNCGDCILLRAALRNRRSRLLFANYIRAFRAFSHSKNLTAVYAYRKAQETQFYRKLSPKPQYIFRRCFFRKTRLLSRRCICIPQGARNEVLREELSPKPQIIFGDAFSQDKENERRRTSVLRAKFDAVFGKLSPETSNHFSVMFFRKTRLLSRRCICIPQGARNAVLRETQPETSAHFSAMFFRKTRKMSDGVLSVLRAKFDAVFGKLSPKPQHIFRRCFFRKTRLLSRRCICIPQGARNAVLQETQPETSNPFSVMFFRKTRKMSDGVLSVLRTKFDAVLRKNSPKNQISIMSASFFFAISSISLTYLSVIF